MKNFLTNLALPPGQRTKEEEATLEIRKHLSITWSLMVTLKIVDTKLWYFTLWLQELCRNFALSDFLSDMYFFHDWKVEELLSLASAVASVNDLKCSPCSECYDHTKPNQQNCI